MPSYWVIAPVESRPAQRFEKVWQFDLTHNLISVGWDAIGDISKLDREALSDAVRAAYPEKPPHSRALIVNMLWAFGHEIRPGDFVIAKRGRSILKAVGRVVCRSFYAPGKNPFLATLGYSHNSFLKVKWQPEPRDKELHEDVFPEYTLKQISETDFRSLVTNTIGIIPQWRRSISKKNGGIRKRFEQWGVPSAIRKELGLSDGSACTLSIRLGTYSVGPRVYILTSGGEFRLSKDMADALRERALAKPGAEIVFEIQTTTSQNVALDNARKVALEEGAFDPQNEIDARDRVSAVIVRRQGQPAFRKKLLKAYNNRCAISRCDCPDALEAAHIRPYRGRYTNHIKNGILLRSDIHTLVDLGKIRIRSNYRVEVCKELLSTDYKEFHNRLLVRPKEKKNWPDCSMA